MAFPQSLLSKLQELEGRQVKVVSQLVVDNEHNTATALAVDSPTCSSRSGGDPKSFLTDYTKSLRGPSRNVKR